MSIPFTAVIVGKHMLTHFHELNPCDIVVTYGKK